MDARARTNPFPGLRPFMPEEADLFFGRDKQSDELVRRLAGRRFLAVVGTSGSGKSSLVRAGLLPSLQGGFMSGAGAHWRMAILRPQDDPIGFLARALVEIGVLAHLDLAVPAAEGIVETTLRRSSLGLVEAARLARLEAHENLLIVVDQFEELFRFADLARERGAAEEAPAFVKLLLEATRQTQVPVYVVVTMRSDFLGDCARFRDLPEAISDSQYLIPRLTRDELQAGITGPVGVRGGHIAPSLVQRLLNDVGDDMDQLPVLQHALMRAWDHWEHHRDGDARPIEVSDLEAIGDMAHALSQHADEAYASLTTERDRKIAERLFKGLTERGPDNREIRRPTTLNHLAALASADPAEIARVVDVFRAPGRSFLMPPCDVALEADSVIDISHESLIRQWARLRTWVEEEAESRATYLRVVEAARLHAAGRTGLWGELDLVYARQWRERDSPNAAWAARYGPGFEDALAFLSDSEAALAAELERERREAQAEQLAKERELEQAKALAEAQRQRADEQAEARIRQRRLSWGLVALLLLSVGAAGFGWFQQRLAEEKRLDAENQKKLAWSRQLSMGVRDAISEAPQIAYLLGVANYRANPSAEARENLQRAFTAHPHLATFLGHVAEVSGVAFSPDGKTLATAGRDKTVTLWDVASRQPVGEPLKGHEGEVSSIAFSPDGKTLATGGKDKTVILWDVANRKPLGEPLKGHQGEVASVAFHPDGRTLASASSGFVSRASRWVGTLIVWEVATGKKQELDQGDVSSVAFSSDGKMLAAGSRNGAVVLWDTAVLKPLGEPLSDRDHHDERKRSVESMALSPDGTTLATGGNDGSITLWDVATRAPKGEPLMRHQGPVSGVAFSPDGKILVSSSLDSTVVLWDVSKRAPLGEPLRGHQQAVTGLAFSPDGQLLASAGKDRAVILWDVVAKNRLGARLNGPPGGVTVAFSPDGKTLASSSDEQSVKLSSIAPGERPTELLGEGRDPAWYVAFSPDGKLLAAASSTKNAVAVWDVAGRKLLGRLTEGHRQPVATAVFSPDGKRLATASQDKTVILWDVETLKPVARFPLDGEVWAVAFSPDGKTLASGTVGKTIVLWDVANASRVAELKGHEDAIMSLAFSPDGVTLASASVDKTIRLWHYPSRAPLGQPLVGHLNQVLSVAFSPDGRTLASAGIDKTVILWDVASRRPLGKPLRDHRDMVSGVAFSPDGKFLASASDQKDRAVVVWDIDVAAWLPRACAIANRNLTRKEWAHYMGEDVSYQPPCPDLPVPRD